MMHFVSLLHLKRLNIVLLLLMVGFTDSQQQYQDVAVMAHVIGNGAMNIDHYFHTLGVSCENKSPSLWKLIDQEYKKCTTFRSPREGFYASLPKGSFEKMCRHWKVNEACNLKMARDLDGCLGRGKGTDALEFVDAFVIFTCRDIRDTENQVTLRVSREDSPPSPGVFKCYPALQDRILNCVKKKEGFSNSQCNQVQTVQQCFASFYSNHESCNDLATVGYMRDLFRSITSKLGCPESGNVWEAGGVQQQQQPPSNSEDGRHFILEQKGARIQWSGANGKSQNYPESALIVGGGGGHEVSLLPYPTPTPSFPQLAHLTFATDSNGEREWIQVPLLSQPQPNPPTIGTMTNLNDPPPSSFFRLDQLSKAKPTWAWGYERYGDGDYDRFYSFRSEPQKNTPISLPIRNGLYKVPYQLNCDRYGSRGLSNRNIGGSPPPAPPLTSSSTGERRGKTGAAAAASQDDHYDYDNHLRKYKNDHEFQTTGAPQDYEIRYIVPFKRTVQNGHGNYPRVSNAFGKSFNFSKVPTTQAPKTVRITSTPPQIYGTSKKPPTASFSSMATSPNPNQAPSQQYPHSSDEERDFETTPRIIVRRYRVRKRKGSSTTSSTETSTEY